MPFESQDTPTPGANIKVIGVGGGGTNAVSTMIRSNIEGVDFVAANSDVQSLRFALAPAKIQLGKELTKGLGAGADPDIGRDSALEDRHEISEALSGADMVFITAGMGGGTGTGGASVVSQIARDAGALTVGVVTKPFSFEGKRRKKHAELGIEKLRENVDTLIVIPNDRLLKIATPDLSMLEAFRFADNVLVNAVRGISDIINVPGTINVDFADVKTVMASMGQALMGIGTASGEKRAVDAAKQAISSPLLEDVDIEGATGILINITAGEKISLMEVNEACSIVQEAAHEDANIIFGAVIDEGMNDDIRVTVIATGFPNENHKDFSVTPVRKEPLSGITYRQPQYEANRIVDNQAENFQTHDKKITDRFEPHQAEANRSQLSESAFGQEAMAKSEQAENLTMRTRSAFDLTLPPKSHSEFSSKLQDDENLSDAEKLTQMTMQATIPDTATELANEENSPAASLESRSLQEAHNHSHETENQNLERAIKDIGLHDPIESDGLKEAANMNEDIATGDQKLVKEQENAVKSQMDLDLGVDPTNFSDEIDRKIDEALQLAERVKTLDKSSDELDIPAFIRNNSKNLPF